MLTSSNYYKPIPKSCRGQFKPPTRRDELQLLLKSAYNGVVRVPCSSNGLVYLFRGIESLDELTTALLYVMKQDYYSGAMTNAAKQGYVVYNHSEYEKAKRSLSRGLQRGVKNADT